jgi:2'-5' RNA ligase
VGGRLAAARLYEAEKRPFWPHVTVARVRAEGRGSRRPQALERPPKELPPGLSEAFHGVRLTLYRSELQPLGARYVPLAQVELPGAGRQ